MTTLRKLYFLTSMMLGLASLQACDSKDGPMEEAGEAIDKAAQDIADDVDDAVN